MSGDTIGAYIIGPDCFLNELVAYAISEAVGVYSVAADALDIDMCSRAKGGEIKRWLLLRDVRDVDIRSPWSGLGIGANHMEDMFLLALFNISPTAKLPKSMMDIGVRGVFFTNDNLAVFTKGVPAILKGELWYPREALLKWVSDREETTVNGMSPLTAREREVLALIAAGLSNDEIGDDLNISPHTVKNHITKIYSKIGVPSRLQAAMWAAANL